MPKFISPISTSKATQRCAGDCKSHGIILISLQALQSVVLQAKKLGKSVYVFSVDSEQGKVAHVNYVADHAKAQGVDGREWANAVLAVLGGKVTVFSSGCNVSTDRLSGRR